MKAYAPKESQYREKSMYAESVREQIRAQPHYCEPGHADGKMKGAKRNTQAGPKE